VIAGHTRATGLAIGADGRIDISHRGISVGTGECSASTPDGRLPAGLGGMSAFSGSPRM